MPVNNLIQLRRGAAAAWTSANPTLAQGEVGIETDTGLVKIGDGSTAWTSLAYLWYKTANNTLDDGSGNAAIAGNLKVSSLTASRAAITDGSKNLSSSAATSTELGYLSGVTSAIQTQLGTKPAIITQVSLAGQSADISTTTLASAAGLYRVSYSLQDTTSALAAGAVVLTIAYTDGGGAATSTATQILTGTGRTAGDVFLQLASGNLTYAISHTGIYSTAQYALYIVVEKVG